MFFVTAKITTLPLRNVNINIIISKKDQIDRWFEKGVKETTWEPAVTQSKNPFQSVSNMKPHSRLDPCDLFQ